MKAVCWKLVSFYIYFNHTNLYRVNKLLKLNSYITKYIYIYIKTRSLNKYFLDISFSRERTQYINKTKKGNINFYMYLISWFPFKNFSLKLSRVHFSYIYVLYSHINVIVDWSKLDFKWKKKKNFFFFKSLSRLTRKCVYWKYISIHK